MKDLVFRSARLDDLDTIVAMIARDSIAAKREGGGDPQSPAVRDAFLAIDDDPNNHLIVAERNDAAIAVLQLTFIPGLNYQGGTRAQIEAVRVAESERGTGIGGKLVSHAIDRARARHCALVQLTTDKRREDTAAFYVELGFTQSHTGMKLWLK